MTGDCTEAVLEERDIEIINKKDQMYELDGGILEGGGQILRMATAFSVILKKPVRVYNIRAGRSNPGLRPQHMNGLQLLRDISGGSLTGDEVGSTAVTLHPVSINGGSYLADTRTAGSIGLLLQVSLPCLIFANGSSHLTLKGGTDADMAPPFDFTVKIIQPVLEKIGIKCHFQIERRGFYPKGGGIAHADIEPVKFLKPIEILDRGHIMKITGRSFVAGLPNNIMHQMADAAIAELKKKYKDIEVNIERVAETSQSAFGFGTGIFLVAETSTGCRLAGSALGKKGVRANIVGQNAAEILIRNIEHGGCVDEYLQDQLIIFMALANGTSKVKCGPITLHTETAIHVAHQMTKAKFNIIKNDPLFCIIECEGHGIKFGT